MRALRAGAAIAVATCLVGVSLGSLANGAGVRGQVRRMPVAAASRHRNPVCPTRAATLPRRGFERGAGRAAQYFMTHVPRSQFPGAWAKRTDRMDRGGRVLNASLAGRFRFWRHATRLLCGSEMVDRTVVVDLRFPHVIGSGEIGTVFVMRTPRGAYRVWYLWHP